jgi:hypothetical protein
VVIGANGAPTFKDEPAQSHSKMPEILKKLDCPEATPVEVSRLISQELAIIASEMSLCNVDSTGMKKLKACAARLEALNALAKAAKETQALAKHDELNFDGPKFTFVFDKLLEYFGQAIEQALGKRDEDLKQRIMKQFRDTIAMNEAGLRRETKRIGS